MPTMARLACQREPSLAIHSKSVGAEGAPKGRHNPKSGDWDTIEVVVTTAIEVQARKRRQRQQERARSGTCYRNRSCRPQGSLAAPAVAVPGRSGGGSSAVAGTVAVAVSTRRYSHRHRPQSQQPALVPLMSKCRHNKVFAEREGFTTRFARCSLREQRLPPWNVPLL